MSSATARSKRFDSIDDYLGPDETRFFGSGYRRVRYHFEPKAKSVQQRATARIEYPADWSTKATGAALRPHLSTIDGLVLGAEIVDRHVRHRGTQHSRAATRHLRRVDIRAGSAPYEEGLDRVPVELTPPSPADAAPGGERTIFDCRVGNMQLRYEVDQPTVQAASAGWSDAGPGPFLAAGEVPLYGADYRSGRQRIERVSVDTDGRRADATVTLERSEQDTHLRHASLIDSFVVSLQLGQVLLYELDGLDRAGSNTLWMRQTTILTDVPLPPVRGPFPVTTALTGEALIQVRGRAWRRATILGECAGVRTRCAVAHELPHV